MRSATARAHSNIALVKYWGKRDAELNIPAVGSISMTLSGFHTTTTITEHDLDEDIVFLDGSPAPSAMTERTARYLDLLRKRTGVARRIRTETTNNFPTASGLASSASGFAALATAFNAAFDLGLDPRRLGILARLGSGSAPRSLFAGFVEMLAGRNEDGEDAFAVPLAPQDHWDIRLLVAVNGSATKKVGSTKGMERTRETSPYWDAWIATHAKDLDAARRAIRDRNFELLGKTAEADALAMHAAIMASRPSVLYWNPTTLECIRTVFDLRESGVPCYLTIDAGPHVKVLALPEHSDQVAKRLREINGVAGVYPHRPGPGAAIIPSEGGSTS